jgi:hypothetical protein
MGTTCSSETFNRRHGVVFQNIALCMTPAARTSYPAENKDILIVLVGEEDEGNENMF